MAQGGSKAGVRILVCGHAGIPGTTSCLWSPNGLPNPVDHDVAILDLSTVPDSLLPLRMAKIQEFVDRLVRLLNTAGHIVALLPYPAPSTKVLRTVVGSPELTIPASSLLPVPVMPTAEHGETVQLSGSKFDWYLAHMKKWNCHFEIGISPAMLERLTIALETKRLAVNREGRALATQIHYSNGATIAVLPVIPSQDTRQVVDRIAAMYKPQGDATPPPHWAPSLFVPGYAECSNELKGLELQAEVLAEKIRQQQIALGNLDAWRGLLFETGPVLEQLVADALRLIGAQILEKRFGNEEYVVQIDGTECLVEVKGRGGSASLTDCRQVNDHVLDAEDADGRRRKGILISNCWRLEPPEIRGDADRPEFPSNVVDHGQRNEIALVSSKVLFAAVTEVLQSRSADAKWRRRLVETSGVVPME